VAGQSSSVYDLALIFRALLDQPRAATVLRTRTAQIPPVPGRSAGYQIQNKNPLLSSYPGNLGAKNGFTHAARHGFVTAAERGGRRIVVSILGSEAVPLRAPDQAARLLNWGFSVPAGTEGVGRLIDPAEAAALAAPPTHPRHADATGTPSPAAVADPPPDPARGATTPVVPVVLGALVLVTAALLLAARRRASGSGTASVPATSPAPESGLPPRPTGGSPSTPP
jgi:D-alanyl-D-alanine carboxypeptidase (penicillin-binding protein 5/6)